LISLRDTVTDLHFEHSSSSSNSNSSRMTSFVVSCIVVIHGVVPYILVMITMTNIYVSNCFFFVIHLFVWFYAAAETILPPPPHPAEWKKPGDSLRGLERKRFDA